MVLGDSIPNLKNYVFRSLCLTRFSFFFCFFWGFTQPRLALAFYCIGSLDLLGVIEEQIPASERQLWREWLWQQHARTTLSLPFTDLFDVLVFFKEGNMDQGLGQVHSWQSLTRAIHYRWVKTLSCFFPFNTNLISSLLIGCRVHRLWYSPHHHDIYRLPCPCYLAWRLFKTR